MIRPARTDEAAAISKVLNAAMALDGVQLQPLPVREAKAVMSDILSNMVETADVEDYFIGQGDGGYYTTMLGAMNSVLAHLVPGVLLAATGDRLSYFVDEDRFAATMYHMKMGLGLVVNIRN